MMKHTFFLLLLALMPTSFLSAQNADNRTIDISMNTRFDFAYDDPQDVDATSGFHGRFLNLMIKGNINSHLSYSLRHRLNRSMTGDDVFKATDWVHLTYKINDHWAVSGGKQIVAIGGFEYDAAPINIYYASMFWNNIACYQFGVSATYNITSSNSLTAQICNSPYMGMNSSSYAYNLMWVGKVGCWSTLWSANYIECAKGEYVNYLALGNRFNIGALQLDVDLMARTYEHQKFLKDYSIMAKAQYAINPYINVFAVGGYDRIDLSRFDASNPNGYTEKPYFGGGVEVFPIKNYRDLRLHAVYNVNHGGNGVELRQFAAGATWYVNLLNK